MKKKWHVSVPGSTSNLGPGFDSIGLAVNRHLEINVETANDWSIDAKITGVPSSTDNFFIQTMIRVAKQYNCNLPPLHVTMDSNIPLARGLGSSAAAIIASLTAVNEICHLQLSDEEMLKCASEIEGHPDNVAASLYGGMVFVSENAGQIETVSIIPNSVDLIAFIPPRHLMTHAARRLLPSQMAFSSAVKASSLSNVLVASLINGDWRQAGRLMTHDLFHQPYRKPLLPEWDAVSEVCQQHHAYGFALSGAGPTLMIYAEKGSSKLIQKQLQSKYPDYNILLLAPEQKGAVIEEVPEEVLGGTNKVRL